MDLYYVEAMERAEGEIDRFILKRERDRSEANEVAAMWTESTRRHQENRRRENRAAWYEFEMLLADNHRQLCEEHENRARALLEPGEEP